MGRPAGSKKRAPNAEGKWRCATCQEWKTAESFYSHKLSPCGLDARCKACTKLQNNARPSATKRKDNKTQRENRDKLLRELKDRPCDRCGGRFHPAAMDFHHRDPKTRSSKYSMRFLRKETLLAEVKLCDLLCATCHRTIHAEQRECARSAKEVTQTKERYVAMH